MNGFSFFQCVASPFHSFVTTHTNPMLGLHCFLRLAHASYCHTVDAWLVLLSPCNTNPMQPTSHCVKRTASLHTEHSH